MRNGKRRVSRKILVRRKTKLKVRVPLLSIEYNPSKLYAKNQRKSIDRVGIFLDFPFFRTKTSLHSPI